MISSPFGMDAWIWNWIAAMLVTPRHEHQKRHSAGVFVKTFLHYRSLSNFVHLHGVSANTAVATADFSYLLFYDVCVSAVAALADEAEIDVSYMFNCSANVYY